VSSLLLTARFATTVVRLDQIPRASAPEVVFVGRSNAGKSSAINILCQRRRLAFASKTPGRTQALNFFALGPEGVEPRGFLVDAPGYGYAATPHEVRAGWDRLAGRYLQARESLAGVVLVMDCRRGVTALDRQLLEFIAPHLRILVLLTKIDKLGNAERARTVSAVKKDLDDSFRHADLTLAPFSANTGLGVMPVRAQIEAWLVEPDQYALASASSSDT
jgi:GTP-binding protein